MIEMQTPILSLITLFFVIAISVFQRVNIGFLSLSIAWILGYFIAGLTIPEVTAGFPISIFIVLVAVSYLFGIAQLNGTLDKLTHYMVQLAKGQKIFLPLIFFVLAAILSTLGVGNIATVALLAPIAMTMADRTGIGAFFMTIMLISGANAGTFSPFAFTGIIADGLVAQIGLSMNPWTQIYLPSLLVQAFIALVCYSIFFMLRKQALSSEQFSIKEMSPLGAWTQKQILTLIAIVIFIAGVVFLKIDVGLLAMILGVILTIMGAADGEEAVKTVPWSVVMMVCGVSTLVVVVEKTGGTDILITWLAKVSSVHNVTGVMALITGIISSYSSSSAVVMPTFIPLVPGLIAKMGGGDPVALVSSINVGSHVVDVSPLSTLGALCMASAAQAENKKRLFYRLMFYGLSMSLVGAAVSYVFFGLLWNVK